MEIFRENGVRKTEVSVSYSSGMDKKSEFPHEIHGSHVLLKHTRALQNERCKMRQIDLSGTKC